MDILYKFLKVFNSAQKPWQLTLAIVLAMFSGFLPLTGIQSVLIFLIALIINIPVGIYFFFVAPFLVVGYWLDPLFESVGFSLLHIESLNGLWTAFYNNGWMRLTNFDNTLVLGSMVVSLILALPLYWIVKKVLEVYRVRLAAYFGTVKYLKKLKLFEVSDKKVKTFRVWGFGLFAVVMGLVLAFVFIFMDSLFKKGIESGLGAVLDKEVKIKELSVDLGNAALNINGLEIQGSDKQTSMMYINEVAVDVDFNALLLHKTQIEHINVKGMSFAAPLSDQFAQREPSQTAPAATESSKRASSASSMSSTAAAAEASSSETPSGINLPKVEDVLKSEKLKSSQLAETTKQEYAAISSKWEKVVSQEFGPAFRQSLTNDLNAIKAQAGDLKRVADTKAKAEALNQKISTATSRIAALRGEFQADKSLLEKRIAEIQKAKEDDFKGLKSKYSFDKGGAISVVGAFFGDKIKGYLDTANSYYEQFKPYLGSDEKEAEPTPQERHEGRWVKFAQEGPLPSLLIRKVDVDGKFRTQNFQALVTNITDDQKALGKTTKIRITSDGEDIKKMVISGDENRLGDKAVTTVNYSAERVKGTAFDLAFVSLMGSDLAVKGGFKMIDGKIDNKAHLTFSKADLRVKGVEGVLGAGLEQDLKKTKSFTVDINAKGTLTQPDIEVRSSLEKVIMDSMKRILQVQVDAFEKKLNQELSKIVGRDLGEIDLSRLSGIDKALNAEDQTLNSTKRDAQKSVDSAVNKALPKVDTKKLQNFLKF